MLTKLKLSILFFFFIPLLSKVKFNILIFKKHKIIVKLPTKRINNNQYKTLYFGAQTMMAEALPYLFIYLLLNRQAGHYQILTQSFSSHFYRKADSPLYLSLKPPHGDLQQKLHNLNEQQHSQTLTFTINGFCFKHNKAILTSQFTLKLNVKQRHQQQHQKQSSTS